MSWDLISKRIRIKFREFFVGWTLREISNAFDGAGLRCDPEYSPQTSGQRRSLVEPAESAFLIYAFLTLASSSSQSLVGTAGLSAFLGAFLAFLFVRLGKAMTVIYELAQEQHAADELRRSEAGLTTRLEQILGRVRSRMPKQPLSQAAVAGARVDRGIASTGIRARGGNVCDNN